MANALRLRRKYPISTCRDYSVTCASRLTNESMDFVYLDARHDCTLHASSPSVLGLSLLRWPHSSHLHIPRLTALIDSPSCPMFSLPADKGVLADLNAYWPKLRRGGIMAGYRPTAHTSTALSARCQHVAQHPPRRENDAMACCVPPVNPPRPLRVLQARLYLGYRRRAGGRQRRRRLDDQL